ncbi:ABC transporter [Nocardioides sp. SYSU D00065]|uniref:ABC transporter n=1 Tax=Nocardioides sp. SYSU D00065 TaxID=2817378 RepID=UPI001B33C7A7|nr:ABC transporter [Nocardioides sp. SYSU D00065]
MSVHLRAALAVPVLLLASACAADRGPTSSDEDSADVPAASADDDHGAVEGAREVAEPQLHLVTVGADGETGLLDLLSEESRPLDRIAPPSALTTDGRYVLATVDDGLAVLDSGAWTWDHGDHFHYYRAEPRSPGTVPGRGRATVSTGPLSTAGGTGVYFAGSGEMVLLDNEALADGELRESFRLQSPPHRGLVAPFAGGAVVTVPDERGVVRAVERVDGSGEPVEGSRERCADAAGTITTAVGLVVGCADGALLWTEQDDRVEVERIPYPRGTDAPPATAFSARKARPTVAALAGPTSYWLLDTRERTWQLHDAGVPLLRVSASDDDEGHVVALDRRGRVRVYAADSGEQLGASAPVLARTVRDSGSLAGVDLVVDQERAYVNAPAEGVVLEVDYADSARVARTLRTTPAPAFFAETGR